MRRARSSQPAKAADLEGALSTLSADELREIVVRTVSELDERAQARVTASIIARAARSGSGWSPAGISAKQVKEATEFVRAAVRSGGAEPSEVDGYLQRGSAAFLGRDYSSARQIFGALIPPVANGDIDLGYHEMPEEVLGADIATCAAQYVVAIYMTEPASDRATALREAISAVRNVGSFSEPLRELERVAIEPLPALNTFLSQWHELIEREAATGLSDDSDFDAHRWQREVVLRLEGTEGLARVARSTRRPEDLNAWCSTLAEDGKWTDALAANVEAAAIVSGNDYWIGAFLDGAALAAKMSGQRDLAAYFERAWRGSPSLPRLLRWLGTSATKAALARNVAAATAACPAQASRQRMLLLILARDFDSAAQSLATSAGLGWSHKDHPGRLAFPALAHLLGDQSPATQRALEGLSHDGIDFDDGDWAEDATDRPRLEMPSVEGLLERAGLQRITDRTTRSTVLVSMRTAAERRVAGVTGEKRRRHYGDAAQLVATCVACDATDVSATWAEALKAEYRRFPALRAELDLAMRAAR